MMYISQIIMLYLKLIQCCTSIISIKLEENAFKQKEKKTRTCMCKCCIVNHNFDLQIYVTNNLLLLFLLLKS